jgi:hypothetical protein
VRNSELQHATETLQEQRNALSAAHTELASARHHAIQQHEASQILLVKTQDAAAAQLQQVQRQLERTQLAQGVAENHVAQLQQEGGHGGTNAHGGALVCGCTLVVHLLLLHPVMTPLIPTESCVC